MTIPISKVVSITVGSHKLEAYSDTVVSLERIKPKFLCGYYYMQRFASTKGRHTWVTVIGYDNNRYTDFELICTPAKPTKRQIRQWKRKYR